MFITSYSKPCPSAPSPKKHTATCPVFKRFAERAAPVAMPALPPTMALAPRFPVSGSAMCMEPPFPLVAGFFAEQFGKHSVECSTFGETVSVAPMGARDVIGRLERLTDANGNRFFAYIKVGETGHQGASIEV